MKAMETLQDLIEEAKLRTVWWALCIFAITYFLSHTSKSMWMNMPIALLLVSGLRILSNEVEFRWKDRKVQQKTYLSHLERKQLSVNDSRLSTLPPPPKWKRKIGSPIVEAAIEDFVSKLLQDFVVDLWYSEITPDREAPELIYAIIMDVLGEVSGRIKEINLVELLTRDVVDLIGNHLDLFRRNQAAIGVDVMVTLSSEERDERLKHHLLASKELHPALISSECEYKVLQQLMGGVLAIVLRPRESQCPLVRCIAREFLTCLVIQPIMNLASSVYINQLIESIFIALKDEGFREAGVEQPSVEGHDQDRAVTRETTQIFESSLKKNTSSYDQGTDMMSSQFDDQRGRSSDVQESSSSNTIADEPVHPRSAEWARVLEAATQRRTEVLMPENLENMWAIGRNYKKKLQKNATTGLPVPGVKVLENSSIHTKDIAKQVPIQKPTTSNQINDKALMQLIPRPHPDNKFISGSNAINNLHFSLDLNKNVSNNEGSLIKSYEGSLCGVVNENTSRPKKSNSTSDLRVQPEMKDEYANKGGPIISEFHNADYSRHNEVPSVKNAADMMSKSEALHASKLKSRVVGAYFEKLGSKSFAVYSIAVTDANKNTWFVKRRYRNFERLHRHLKDIPNYTLHLPPKRIFSSSTEDAFVHQRCIQLDKYLQDLLSIANVAEQHEVWDFLSASSKNYSFGKSSSMMHSLAVNVDDAMDDIVRQFKGVSDGLMRKVVGPSSSSFEPPPTVPPRHLSWNVDDMDKLALTGSVSESVNSFSDNEESYKDGKQGQEEAESCEQANGWHSDNELNSKVFPPRVVRRGDKFGDFDSEKKHDSVGPSKSQSLGRNPESSLIVISDRTGDPVGVPPEWTPPNLSLPVLNLVDKIFQLNKRGWLRRQVFWISKQILQLMMEDAIDDWLLMQIHWLRREDVVAQGIQWIQNVLWPDGAFFLKLNTASEMDNYQPQQGSIRTTEQPAGSKVYRPGSFEQQLEAARRASDVKEMLYNGAPSALVSLIGQKQYRRCARDLYYFLQSTICLKQLAYGILELVLLSIFPELRDLVMDVHVKMRP